LTRCSGKAGPFKSACRACCRKRRRVSALKSLWRYNFSPDVGPYREIYKPGRWYAMAGEAGLLMCSFPRRDWDYAQAKAARATDWAAGYFNECMNGFEYQAAGHMIWEGLTLEGPGRDARACMIVTTPRAAIRGTKSSAAIITRAAWPATACIWPRAVMNIMGRSGTSASRRKFRRRISNAPSRARKAGAAIRNVRKTARLHRAHRRAVWHIEIENGGAGICRHRFGARVALGNNVLRAMNARTGRRVLVTLSEPVEIPAGQTLEIQLS
jgi:hypothetical protein